MIGMAFGPPSMLCALACLLYFFSDPVASQGLCEGDNLIIISSTTPVPVVSLQQPLCFGCLFTMGLDSFPIPLGTEWSVVSGSSTTLLTNGTDGVVLSGTNGTVLLESPSSLLAFGTSQIRCTYTTDANVMLSIVTTLAQAVLNPPMIEGVNDAGESFGIEGETVTLSCTNEDNGDLQEEFRWLNSEGMALDLFGVVRPHVLTFENVTRNDSGVYICEVAVTGASFLVDTTLIVQYPALILSGPFASPPSPLHTGSMLTLSCKFEGVPVPNVTWIVDDSDVDVDGNDRLSVQISDGIIQLMFNPVMGEDSGMYRCAVDNGFGSPSVSTATLEVIVQLPSDPVMNLNVVGIATESVTLEWMLAMFDGNSEITQVDVSYITIDNYMTMASDTINLLPSVTTTSITGLEPHTQYRFSVVAINEVGSSEPVTVEVWTEPLVPGAPSNVSVEAVSSTSLRVTWMGPPFVGSLQTSFDTYKIEYTVEDMTQVETESYPAQTYIIEGLMRGTLYSVRVALNNSAGQSEYSLAEIGHTAFDPPTQVTNSEVTPYPTSLCVSWEVPDSDGGAPINSYRVELTNSSGSIEQNVTVGNDTRLHTFEKLDTNTSYSVTISASNAEAGFGLPSELPQYTSSDYAVLESFTLTVNFISAISIEIAWSPQNGVNEYRIEYRPQGNATWYEEACNRTSYRITGLESETVYEIRAILVARDNCTRLSTPIINRTTEELVVMAVPSIQGVVTSGQSFTLSCELDSGEDAPSVMWIRGDGSEIPEDFVIMDNMLTIPSPVPDDSGDYICLSRDANVTFSLVVQDPPTESTAPSVPGLDLAIVIVIALVAGISAIAFISVLIAAIYLCCCRNKTGTKNKYALKKKGNVWMDEGAGGFIPSTMNPNDTYRTTGDDDIDAPNSTGRRMTTDKQYTAATSFLHENSGKENLSYPGLELEPNPQENSGYLNKENRVEYMTVASSTFHGSKERILSATTTDV